MAKISFATQIICRKMTFNYAMNLRFWKKKVHTYLKTISTFGVPMRQNGDLIN